MPGHFILLIIFIVFCGSIVYALYHYRARIEILKEFFEFLREKKLWWIMPIVGLLLIVGILIVCLRNGRSQQHHVYSLLTNPFFP